MSGFIERVEWLLGRIMCRVLRRHTRGCRGRTDHIRDDGKIIDPGRWTR